MNISTFYEFKHAIGETKKNLDRLKRTSQKFSCVTDSKNERYAVWLALKLAYQGKFIAGNFKVNAMNKEIQRTTLLQVQTIWLAWLSIFSITS